MKIPTKRIALIISDWFLPCMTNLTPYTASNNEVVREILDIPESSLDHEVWVEVYQNIESNVFI